ncbi:hypothetical protein ABEB36_004351 [Hypothenemus hampei]|uniref:Fibronectin type-III domain-containing protein n=1 Tax=Hypothenemus hampei TaxID=57062 RepID=A0ABD1F6U6_HYPHA
MPSDCEEVSETLELAKVYVENLKYLKSDVQVAEQQVLNTFKETRESIKHTFLNIKKNICKILEQREQALITKAENIRDQGLSPLEDCARLIEKNIETTLSLIHEGSHVNQIIPEQLHAFLDKASDLGNLPEVPDPKYVPCLSFYHDVAFENEINNLCRDFGEVFKTAPIQIKSIIPKPGALLIEWQQSMDNDDKTKDIQEFKLQRAFGDVTKEKTITVPFLDCYSGVDTQYLLRDIQISQPYSFRVCCKFEGMTAWSPWSVPEVGLTTLPSFSWQISDSVVLSNDNKILSLKPNFENEIVVFSDGPQVSLTDTVEFTIIEADAKSDLVLALTTKTSSNLKSFKNFMEFSFLIDNNGKIAIGGVEKTTVLSKFYRGLKNFFIDIKYG